MSEPDFDADRLAERNADLRRQVDKMMEEVRRKTEDLKEAQARMTALTGSSESADGVINARVDMTGNLTELTLTSRAYERTPEQLAAEITRVIRKAAAGVRTELHREASQFTPDEDLIDLPDLVPGAPSLRDLFRIEQPEEDETDQPARPSEPVADDDYYDNQQMFRRD
ncbi:YbaB/EbfC family nucleoid-associated protein [Kibdelosporangium philippinense]|uniref:YbaB/EbfC family nucleoid-associated protein n=1 Tax=Kibdelosporangium philippinense TaxID=211113 RepID=A0ABS8ZCZ2_9PSEU|nr:YbaB/EbfC family nucleoid-associated protein [Kibdelosporangium philippinense]MCE7005721.1 YbaB/EbfC family nucleoid-associated protein [Kibdelosporangium philippinense]